MNHLLRREFLALYTIPIMEDLRESFVRRYPDCSFPPLPERGDLDLKQVMSSAYFFS